MSDHTWILEHLAAYLADGLEPTERERLEQHTTECAECAAVLAHLRALDTELTNLFADTRPNPTLVDRVVQTLRILPPRSLRLPIPAWLALAAAALVLIGFTGAVASQILVKEGASTAQMSERHSVGSFMGHYTLNPESQENVDGFASSMRNVMLSRLDPVESKPPDSDRGERFQNLQGTPIPNSPSGGVVLDETYRLEAKSYEPLSSSSISKSKPNEPLSPPPIPKDLPVERKLSSEELRTQFNFWMGFTRGNGDTTPSPTNQTQSSFQPGKVLDDLNAARGPESRNGSGDVKEKKGIHAEQPPAKDERNPLLFPGIGLDTLLQSSPKTGEDKERHEKLPDKPPEQPGSRKIIIRTGEIEYEVQSFDAAVATIARLVKPIKGGFIATVNSDKLANGKVRGSVVVRVPPESLDALLLEIRGELGKSGELKNQRIGSQDITKQYTDSESELRAARAMEERLLQIIKNGKGEIKDLLAVEKELGTWRTRIEKTEGELRYYANQVALSTLTVSLYEKEIAAAYGVIEREQVQMGIEVEDVDQAYQAAQKAVRDAKGRITRAELKQPSQGQFSALLDFEVSPDAAGLLRDRLKQLGTVARFDISRQEEMEGGVGKPSDGKVKRADTRFHVHFYNLTDVPPRETVFVGLACVDVEATMKTLLGRVEKAAGRVVASNLNSTRSQQTQGDLQFQIKTALADAVLEDVKSAGEVMALQVRETTNGETTRKKRGFQIKLVSLEATTARESEEIQLACTEVAASYRRLQEAVVKLKGRVRTAQLNEQDRRKITATLDVEIRRADEEAFREALAKSGEVYTRKTSRAADGDNVVDSKVHRTVTFLNQTNIPPRETYVFGVEVADVDQTATLLSGLAGKREGRTIEANVARERNGRITGKLVYDVPMAEIQPLIEALKMAGVVRVQQTAKHPEVPDSPLALARLEITLSNKELIVPSDGGFGSNVHRGLADSFTILSWSLRFLILGLCVLLPWALVIWGIYRLVVRMRRRSTATA